MESQAPTQHRPRTQAEISEILSRYRQSRLTQVEFSRREGISRSLLSRHLRRERLGAVAARPHGLVEIDSIFKMADGSQREPYRVCLGKEVSVEIPPGFCGVEVARLLSVLGAMERP